MTIQTSSGFQAAARSQTYGQLALVELKLQSGTARFTNWPLTLQLMGQTWQGVGNLGSIGELHESEDGAAEKLTLTLSPVDIGTRALALGDPSDYQDRGVRVWIALLDAATLQVSGEPVLRFAGVMDQMKVERDGPTAKISMECRTASYDVRSNPASLRTNDAQHQVKHPGERGFEYLNSMIGSPTVWVNKYLQMALNYWARARGK
ncbi:hypothetical protein SAMN05216567_106158 [Variovorax sp. OK605]|jgi:hypothetical protein|uniref:hypothetical protein n=1 Tax=unclassified Variovorax TaxID=663243 RepID=UPI0008C5FBD3|nr:MULTISPECIES: hypothetical protein [unclassified Variovorax]SEJ95511.1 hypothetical protein SAMN05518853_105117 [Variovorax sp. OK202]SFD19318.1 hypothetical protein SAMN05444746_105157 [Variovorax sp. OK212]SFP43861.1 hypothetical protein SAMN05216567_106158 [Variovorax sp. OK605]